MLTKGMVVNDWVIASEALPAWIQAIGSVVAILAGFGFVAFQASAERRSRARALKSIIISAAVLCRKHRIAMTNMSESHHSLQSGIRNLRATILSLKEILFRVDLSALTGHSTWYGLTQISINTDKLLNCYDEIGAMLATGEDALPPEARAKVIETSDIFLAAFFNAAAFLLSALHKDYGTGSKAEIVFRAYGAEFANDMPGVLDTYTFAQ